MTHDIQSELAALRAKVREQEELIGEAYIVVGSLLIDLDAVEHPQAQKILDNLSEGHMVHSDVLPFPTMGRP